MAEAWRALMGSSEETRSTSQALGLYKGGMSGSEDGAGRWGVSAAPPQTFKCHTQVCPCARDTLLPGFTPLLPSK